MSNDPEKKSVLCLECETETQLTQDDDGDWIGRCAKCRLDVGRIHNRMRYKRALEKAETPAVPPPKTKKKSDPFED